MKKIIFVSALLFLLLIPLAAMSVEDVNAENLEALFSNAGYETYIDEYGDPIITDQYGMEYWILMDYVSDGMILIQSGWGATENVTSEKAYELMNESNRMMFTIRCYYEPAKRTFYADYALPISADGIDDDVLLRSMEDFLEESDVFTDYLIGEGAM